MKKIFNLLFLLTLVFAVSCDNEDQELLSLSATGSGEITAPANGTTIVLNPAEEQTNPALTLTWNKADYGVPTNINYTVEFAKTGTSFAEPFLAGITSNTVMSWSIMEFNGAAVTAGLTPFAEEGLDIRVTAKVGSQGVMPQTSSTITVYVTPFTTDLPKLSVPGNHQGWDPASAPLIAASSFGNTDYEGYVQLDGDFKFTAPNDQGNFNWDTNWGDDGTGTGKLESNSSTNCTATVGYYFVKANTDELTYSTTAVNWGIIGAATPTGWDSDTDMVYDAATMTLSVDIDLTPGPFKFRGNDEWGQFDLGTLDDDNHLQGGGDLTFDGAAGNYHVVLDLSDPRAYTYSITAN